MVRNKARIGGLAVLFLWLGQGLALGASGEELFKGICAACHGPEGHGNKAMLAPAIGGMQEWYVVSQLKKFRSGARGNHPKDMAGGQMRAMALSLKDDREVEAVAKVVAAFPKPALKQVLKDGKAEDGKVGFMICVSCHQANGKGSQALGAPDLTQTNDWYLLGQLKNFKDKVRGGDASLDPLGFGMSGIVAGVKDEQAMKDILAYVQTLR